VKVSKPVLIFGIVVLLIAGYVFFFTGKKKTPPPPAPAPVGSQQTRQGQQAQPPAPSLAAGLPSAAKPSEPGGSEAKSGQSGTPSLAPKPHFSKLQIAWARNPFILPVFKEEKKRDGAMAIRLSAIFEKGRDRVAIIDHEVVRKGEMVGDEKVFEIDSDKVILIRNGSKRTLYLASDDSASREEEPKTKATEKSK